MSRAFVKESDGDQPGDELPERPQSPHPNYVTTAGLKALERQLEKLQAERRELHEKTRGGDPALLDREHLKTVERDLRYLQERVERAIPIDPATQPADRVGFSATVDTIDENDEKRRFAIVGEDEADPKSGKISWVSPLARALTGAKVGDSALWKRPAGDLTLEIEAISYPKH